jgi:hypothetical protein
MVRVLASVFVELSSPNVREELIVALPGIGRRVLGPGFLDSSSS